LAVALTHLHGGTCVSLGAKYPGGILRRRRGQRPKEFSKILSCPPQAWMLAI
jgi:hypothetical protein